jgi:hypothetical protein
MKKIISLLIALAMIATMSVAAFADGVDVVENPTATETPGPTETPAPAATPNYDSSKTVTVATKINPSFTITIPATVDIDYKATSKSFDVVLSSDSMLDKNYFINVTVSSANSYALVNSVAGVGYEKTDSIPYSLSFVNYVEEGITSDTLSYLYNAGQTLKYTIGINANSWKNIHSGYYSDTLTFDLKYSSTSTLG